MITPTKGIAPDRALLAVGAQIMMILDEPLTVSQTWARFRENRARLQHHTPVSFEWFVLALDVLHALGAVELRRDLLFARRRDDAAPAVR
ncbi:hypothetical protein KQY30_06855 [Streptomyces sp. GMY02]|uniref:ABC-three component system middle component 6 n=1 Tax=Streptomyces sp. GMY02 TaxID=1333528 RepID=UPI001C2C2D07|nr:ABC-three component system middle component 6 [Streptomyces sp. GMY02]QXE34052.1 hypothetical protein KQY30_06855 [Streptomyces sp. GMY02]